MRFSAIFRCFKNQLVIQTVPRHRRTLRLPRIQYEIMNRLFCISAAYNSPSIKLQPGHHMSYCTSITLQGCFGTWSIIVLFTGGRGNLPLDLVPLPSVSHIRVFFEVLFHHFSAFTRSEVDHVVVFSPSMCTRWLPMPRLTLATYPQRALIQLNIMEHVNGTKQNLEDYLYKPIHITMLRYTHYP